MRYLHSYTLINDVKRRDAVVGAEGRGDPHRGTGHVQSPI